jgi:hypothetical protein
MREKKISSSGPPKLVRQSAGLNKMLKHCYYHAVRLKERINDEGNEPQLQNQEVSGYKKKRKPLLCEAKQCQPGY